MDLLGTLHSFYLSFGVSDPNIIVGISVNLNAEISDTYDEFILEWMSDCYVTLQWKYRLWSSEIIDIVKPENLYNQYYPLHETSLTNAVTKIYEIYHLKDLCMHRAKRIY